MIARPFGFLASKQLLYTGKTLGDIVAGHTAGMEGTHGQLCTRLTDGLCRDDTDGLAHLHRLAGRHVGAVALRADTESGTAGQNRTDLYFRDTAFPFSSTPIVTISCSTLRGNHVVCLHNHIAVLRRMIVSQENRPVIRSCRLSISSLAIRECFHIHARDLVALLAQQSTSRMISSWETSTRRLVR